MALRIGQLAERTGCAVETIRYYERAGVLPEPARGDNNYRCYGDVHRQRLVFIRRLRDLGFSLYEVRALLAVVDGGNLSCADVKALGERHLADVRAKLADLQRMEATLAMLVGQCSGKRTPDCSMLEALFDERARTAPD